VGGSLVGAPWYTTGLIVGPLLETRLSSGMAMCLSVFNDLRRQSLSCRDGDEPGLALSFKGGAVCVDDAGWAVCVLICK